jgi:hypothetical protein
MRIKYKYIHSNGVSQPGANPTIASYNGGVVKIYNAASILVHFENKNILKKRSRLLQR